MRGFASLARIHALMAWRRRSLWVTALPLTLFAALLAIISPASPRTGGIEDLAFTGKILAIFSGIAYTTAFADFLTAAPRWGMHELERSAPCGASRLGAARLTGTLAVVVAPSFLILLAMGTLQTLDGHGWGIPAGVAVCLCIVAPSAALAPALSGAAGALLPPLLGRILALLAWLYLVFSTPALPLPTVNGGLLNLVGDTVGEGLFGAPPLYPPDGPLAADGAPWTAALSLTWQVAATLLLLRLGTASAHRTRRD